MFCLYVCLYTIYIPDTFWKSEGSSDGFPGPGVMSGCEPPCWCCELQTLVLCKSIKGLNL